ncbi:PREDICTED: uncharacterized protein LOC108769007 [Trachymyrmex cornetzi]|uniref:uncharacterized protein LOC108769007 n=1 Tax=Trachymyrmex cornetzi TaxID=471704 RepID=UPI00084F820A|nr:PREDICTED: uncharacterized protein LOC108769007 [Trachymyrmex cornetzi]
MCGIMPHCIAPGCTSGYKSNPEKVHFFTVPKDENMITLWQNAIRRKDFVIRAGQFLCEKHFLPEDILWKRELTSPDGQVLGVSHYRQPRLRKGVIPSQFPWMEISTSVSLDNSLLQDTPFQETVYKFDALHCTRNNLQEARSDEPSKFSFINLITCATLQIPINWIRRTVTCEAITMESFTNVMCRKIGNSFITVNIKELIVQENLCLKINVMCKPFDVTSFGISSDAISSIEDIEAALIALNLKNICCGASTNNVCTHNSSISYIDHFNILRHKQCIVLLDNENQCTHCKRLCQTLKRKKLRLEKQQNKRIRLTLTPRNNEKLLKLRNKCHAALKAKKRAQVNIAKIKANLEKVQRKMAEINNESVDEMLTNRNVPKNQRIAIKEIISAANSKNKHGKRYSEEWLLLCMLMHMRSPMSYNFLRDNEILPLPCVSFYC